MRRFKQINFRIAIALGQISWQKHVLIRMAERHILQKDVIHVLLSGEVIREYGNDRPFPSILLLGWIDERPLHVVAAFDDETTTAFIITAYEPSPDIFESDYKTKRA